MGAINCVSLPMNALRPITVLCLDAPSKLHVMVPQPTLVPSPTSASPTVTQVTDFGALAESSFFKLDKITHANFFFH